MHYKHINSRTIGIVILRIIGNLMSYAGIMPGIIGYFDPVKLGN